MPIIQTTTWVAEKSYLHFEAVVFGGRNAQAKRLD